MQGMNIWKAYPIYLNYMAVGWGGLSLFEAGRLLLGALGICIFVAVPIIFLCQR
jgi:hypothetical protein